MQSEIFRRLPSVPALVHVVLTQATRRRAERSITDSVYNEQIDRIAREELNPKGLKLLVRELQGGRIRFIIKEQASGVVCEMMTFDSAGTLEPDSAELVDTEAPAK
jgi:hypothetical protein